MQRQDESLILRQAPRCSTRSGHLRDGHDAVPQESQRVPVGPQRVPCRDVPPRVSERLSDMSDVHTTFEEVVDRRPVARRPRRARSPPEEEPQQRRPGSATHRRQDPSATTPRSTESRSRSRHHRNSLPMRSPGTSEGRPGRNTEGQKALRAGRFARRAQARSAPRREASLALAPVLAPHRLRPRMSR